MVWRARSEADKQEEMLETAGQGQEVMDADGMADRSAAIISINAQGIIQSVNKAAGKM